MIKKIFQILMFSLVIEANALGGILIPEKEELPPTPIKAVVLDEKSQDLLANLELAESLEEIRLKKFEEEKEKALEKQKQIAEEKRIAEEKKRQAKSNNNFEALVNATWRLETGNGTSKLWLERNNAGGIKCGTSYCQDVSGEAGMQRLRNLLKRYVARYGYDLEAIRSVYSESNDTELFRQIFNEERSKLK